MVVADGDLFDEFSNEACHYYCYRQGWQGQIIIVSSVTGIIGAAQETAYTATKFANRGMAQSLNKEFRTSGIRVTCLEPSCIYTEFEMGNGRTKEQMEKKKGTTLSAEDLAEAVVYIFTRRKEIRVMEMYLAGMQEDRNEADNSKNASMIQNVVITEK